MRGKAEAFLIQSPLTWFWNEPIQVCVSPSKADQIVSASLVPLEMAPESLPVPTSSSSPAATAAAGSGPEHGANLWPTRSTLTHRL
ncbi:unnamed protein product [Boreogadus saida]